MNSTVEVKRASVDDIDHLASMFNEYRQFYRQPDNETGCKEFLTARISREESVAFIAFVDDKPSGFIHLYPGFSSVYMKPLWTMNDLYVRSFARRQGVGFALLDRAKALALETGAILVKLSTEQRNVAAQKVYESKGYKKDTTFIHYLLPLKENL